jgi:hypothetical protein
MCSSRNLNFDRRAQTGFLPGHAGQNNLAGDYLSSAEKIRAFVGRLAMK